MKITYDPRYNIAYIRLQEKGAEVETIRISDELNVDVVPNGTVYGIELLNANPQLFTEDQGKLIIENGSPGRPQGNRIGLRLKINPRLVTVLTPWTLANCNS